MGNIASWNVYDHDIGIVPQPEENPQPEIP